MMTSLSKYIWVVCVKLVPLHQTNNTAMQTYTHKVKTPMGAMVKLEIPTNAIAAANVTDGENSPCPKEYVDEEISILRYTLAKQKIFTKVISIRATEYCVTKYLVLERDNFQDRAKAKHIANEFCDYADFLYNM
jgi:hypothetical protein